MTDPFSDPRLPKPGMRLDERFEVIAAIAADAFGLRYEARETGGGRVVRLRVLDPERSRDRDVQARFDDEVGRARPLRGKHTAGILGFGKTSRGCLYVVSEALGGGRTLGERIAEDGPLSEKRAVAVAVQVLDSLSGAHEAGVFHPRLRADSVMIGPRDEVAVSDYGIAEALGLGPDEGASAQDDVYRVGLLLAAMLTGKRGKGLPEALARTRVGRVIKKACEGDRGARHASAMAMKKALEASLVKSALKAADDADDVMDVVDLVKSKGGAESGRAVAAKSGASLGAKVVGIGGVLAVGTVIAVIALDTEEPPPPPPAPPVVAVVETQPAPEPAPELAPKPTPAPEPEPPPAPEPEPAPTPAPEPEPVPAPTPEPAPTPPPAPAPTPEPEPAPEPEPTPEPALAPALAPPPAELAGLSQAQLGPVMRSSIKAVGGCVLPVPEGTKVEIPVTVTVLNDGSVNAVHIEHASADCVRPIIEALRFPTFERPAQTFKYRYLF